MEHFRKHEHLGKFFLYAITFLIHGINLTGLGPFIPYLAL